MTEADLSRQVEAASLLEEFETHDEPDAWEAVRTVGNETP
jgi:hypothetical protein